MNSGKKEFSALRTFLIVLGALVSIAAVIGGLYLIVKKYFNIEFECEGDDECDCDGCYIEEDDSKFAPVYEEAEADDAEDISFED